MQGLPVQDPLAGDHRQLHDHIPARGTRFVCMSVCNSMYVHSFLPFPAAAAAAAAAAVGSEGPAPATFLVPSLLFSAGSGVRSTANGLAAGCGKLGSIAGLLVVGYAGFDISATMTFFGAVAVLGVAASLVTIREHMRAEPGHYFRPPSSASSPSAAAEKQVRVSRSLYLPIQDEGAGAEGHDPLPWEGAYSSFQSDRNRSRNPSSTAKAVGAPTKSGQSKPFARLLAFVASGRSSSSSSGGRGDGSSSSSDRDDDDVQVEVEGGNNENEEEEEEEDGGVAEIKSLLPSKKS